MSEMHENNRELQRLMVDHGLGRRDVGRLTGYSIHANGQCYAVNNWLQRADTTAYRPMPDRALALLRLRLSLLTDAERAQLEGPLDKVAVMARNRLKRRYLRAGESCPPAVEEHVTAEVEQGTVRPYDNAVNVVACARSGEASESEKGNVGCG
jgi:hypothetical protein